jgi:serine phosphatase RsbU (regulator of sigma subunit)
MVNEPGHILIVDDHSTNRLKLSLGLKKQGHTVSAAENGLQALEMLRKQLFDLVLLDIMMPEMDGYEVLGEMKGDDRLRDIPVIIISAMDEMESVVKGIELGAEDYLPKTFDPVLLKARIGACLAKKKLRDLEQLYLKGLERELEIGRQIQASFLPDSLPQLPGWEISVYFQAAREVAGDFYDVFKLSREQKIGLVIGDVCDKGVGAALFMTLFRSLIRAVSNLEDFSDGLELPAMVADSNKGGAGGTARLRNTVLLTNNYVVRTHSQAATFTTLFFGLLDPATGSLQYINGGHEPPLIFSPAGVKARLEPTGPIVGVLPDANFKVQEAHLEPGNILLVFTDGVIDAHNPNQERFTRDRLLRLLEAPAPSAEALLERIQAALQTHMAGANQYDDITLLAVRRVVS